MNPHETIAAKIAELNLSGEDSEIASALNELPPVVRDRSAIKLIQRRTIADALGDPFRVGYLLDDLRRLGEASQGWRYIYETLNDEGDDKGADITKPYARLLVDILSSPGGHPQVLPPSLAEAAGVSLPLLSATEAEAIKRLGMESVSWGESLLGHTLTHLDVAIALGRGF